MDEPKPATLMTEDELETRMDAFFVREFGKTYKEDTQPTPVTQQVDSLAAIMRDFPMVFDAPRSGTA